MEANDQSAALLNQLFSVTNKSLKDNLARLQRPGKVSDRERAEMRKAIEEAETFFTTLNNQAALQELHLLEIEFNRRIPDPPANSTHFQNYFFGFPEV